MNIIELLHKTNLFKSKSEIRRLIEQKGIKIDHETISDINYDLYAPDWDEEQIYINCGSRQGKEIGFPDCKNVKVHNLSYFFAEEIQQLKDTHIYKTIWKILDYGGYRLFKTKTDANDKDLVELYNNYIFTNFFLLNKGKTLQNMWILELY